MRHHFVLGVSYKTATVSQREALLRALPQDENLFAELQSIGVDELVWISTCNRCEFYIASQIADGDKLKQQFETWWAQKAQIDTKNIFYWYAHQDAVEHLFRVSASLDSLLLGESQILGQIKSAYLKSVELGRVKLFLHQLFQTALAFGKEVRSKTGIGQGALSIALAAVQLSKKVFGNLTNKKALVLGAGQMAHLAALHLRQNHIGELSITNRTLDKARILAERHQANVIPWESRGVLLNDFDLIISATAADQYVITQNDLKPQKHKQRVLVDIALPRDIDPILHQMDQVFVFCVDDLQNVMDEGSQKRQDAIQTVEAMLTQKTDEFVGWYKSREAIPAIKSLRTAYTQEMDIELQKWQGHPAFEHIQKALHSVGGKLLHQPSEKLRELGQTGLGHELSSLMSQLFSKES